MGDRNHFWAVTHISGYTYDTSTVALGKRVPLTVGGCRGGASMLRANQTRESRASLSIVCILIYATVKALFFFFSLVVLLDASLSKGKASS